MIVCHRRRGRHLLSLCAGLAEASLVSRPAGRPAPTRLGGNKCLLPGAGQSTGGSRNFSPAGRPAKPKKPAPVCSSNKTRQLTAARSFLLPARERVGPSGPSGQSGRRLLPYVAPAARPAGFAGGFAKINQQATCRLNPKAQSRPSPSASPKTNTADVFALVRAHARAR